MQERHSLSQALRRLAPVEHIQPMAPDAVRRPRWPQEPDRDRADLLRDSTSRPQPVLSRRRTASACSSQPTASSTSTTWSPKSASSQPASERSHPAKRGSPAPVTIDSAMTRRTPARSEHRGLRKHAPLPVAKQENRNRLGPSRLRHPIGISQSTSARRNACWCLPTQTFPPSTRLNHGLR